MRLTYCFNLTEGINMKELQPFQQRVVTERDELKVKADALHSFFSGEQFSNLDSHNKCLLKEQLHYMEQYLSVLDERISLF